MKKATIYTAACFALLLISFSISGCASKKNSSKVKHVGAETKWDHDKIEQNQRYEDASKPSEAQKRQWRQEEANCLVISAAKMRKARLGGCRPLDPGEGHGENMYCCPRD